MLLPGAGWVFACLSLARDRYRRAKEQGDRGSMSAEMMIITGILVATALVALGILAKKIIAKANGLDLG